MRQRYALHNDYTSRGLGTPVRKFLRVQRVVCERLELMQRLLFNIQDEQKIGLVLSSLMLKVNRKDRVEKM